MISYFNARGEFNRLNESTRKGLRGSFVQLSDGVTHYELKGPASGELVVLVPGLTVPLFYWDSLVEELNGYGYRTLAYSAYGRGYSDRVEGPYDYALFVRQLRDLVQVLGLSGPRHIVGASMGALIAMAWVQEQPSLVTSLTLVGPAGLEQQLPPIVRLLRFNTFAHYFGRVLGQRLLRAHLANEVQSSERAEVLSEMVLDAYTYEGSIYALFSTLQSFRLTGQHDLYRKTRLSSVPVHLLWGSGDHVTPIDKFDEALALLQPAKSFSFSDCGHMPPFELPADVAKHMTSFFHEIAAGSSATNVVASAAAIPEVQQD